MSVKKRARTQRETLVVYKQVFGSQTGKEILFDLMNRYHILNEHGGDPYKEGQRSVVLEILRKAKIDLVEYDKLLQGE